MTRRDIGRTALVALVTLGLLAVHVMAAAQPSKVLLRADDVVQEER
jgi:hypothetical protein